VDQSAGLVAVWRLLPYTTVEFYPTVDSTVDFFTVDYSTVDFTYWGLLNVEGGGVGTALESPYIRNRTSANEFFNFRIFREKNKTHFGN
jgi:hypothetical protein